MRGFSYERPTTLAEAVALLDAHGPLARVLAGGTDLIIRLRDGSLQPGLVVDIKRIPDLQPSIDQATLAGNVCNASPAADTAPPLLVYGAVLVITGPAGQRRLPLDAFFVRSGQTTLGQGELVTAIELPQPTLRTGATHVRRTRRRGHDLASVTLTCAVDEAGVTRIAYGSMGPRPYLVVDDSGCLADAAASEDERASRFEELFRDARPSPGSMRASPEYRQAMLRVLAARALHAARERLGEGRAA